MDQLKWPTAVRVVVGIMVAGMVAGVVLLLVLNYDLRMSRTLLKSGGGPGLLMQLPHRTWLV